MNIEKIENKIKELNSLRAVQKKYLKENEKKYHNKEISAAIYNKHKNKIELKIEKIRQQIHKLEEESFHLKQKEK